jgi:outer membrane protein TolC
VLKGDALEVDARLAKAQYDLSVAENGLATQHEHLNQLLARDLETPFRVDFIPEEDTTTLSLEEARQQASENRPEIRQAHLKEKQAEYDRRIAKAEYIPDLGLAVSYHGDSERAGPSDECRCGRLCVDLGTIRLGTPPQSSTRKIEHTGAGTNGAQEAESQIGVEVGRSTASGKRLRCC